MKQVNWGTTGIKVPAVAMGCMRMAGLEVKDAVNMIEKSVEEGVNFFDHADIYGRGKSEEVFAEALTHTSIRREDLFLQSKCAIVPGIMYDFSKEHIIEAVEGSLLSLIHISITVLR